MQAVLTKSDLWEYVSGTNVRPEAGANNINAAAVLAWDKSDQKARSEIILSMAPSELKKNVETSRAVWLRLTEIYQSQDPARKATLLKRLTLHKMAENSDVRDHLNDFFDTVYKLGDMNVQMNPDQLAIMLLYSLPCNFENFRCAIESRDDLPTPEALRAKIIEEIDARRNGARTESSDAMFVYRNKKRSEKWNKNNKGVLNLANNVTTEINGKGTVELKIETSDGSKLISLNNAANVPDLRTNLLSVSKITDQGLTVTFDNKCALITNANGKIELCAKRIRDLYFVCESNEDACVATFGTKQLVNLDLLH